MKAFVVVVALMIVARASDLSEAKEVFASAADHHADIVNSIHFGLANRAGLRPGSNYSENFLADKSKVEGLQGKGEGDALLKLMLHGELSSMYSSLETFVEKLHNNSATFGTGRQLMQARSRCELAGGKCINHRRQRCSVRPTREMCPGSEDIRCCLDRRHDPISQLARPLERGTGRRAMPRLNLNPRAPQAAPKSIDERRAAMKRCNDCRTTKELALRRARSTVTRHIVESACKDQCRNVPDKEVENQMRQLADQLSAGACKKKMDFSKECVESTRPDLMIMGVNGGAGFLVVKGYLAGLEAVVDFTSFEVAFFRYGGKMMGTNIQLVQLEGSVYAGLGHKGNLRQKNLFEAYSGYFSCGTFGGSIIAGFSATACVSSDNKAKLDFAGVKSLVAGPSLSLIPVTVVVSGAIPHYTMIASHTCQHPHCMAALLAFAPASPRRRADVMVTFMRHYCKPGGEHAEGTACKLYRNAKEFIRIQTEKFKNFSRDLAQAVRENVLEGEIGQMVQKAAAESERWLERARLSPETLPNTFSDVPTRPGAYIKIRDCTPVPGVSDPYWRCSARSSVSRSSIITKNTEVGLLNAPGKSNFYWDYNADDRKSGYGLFFPDSQKCIRCQLYDRRILRDRKVDGLFFDKCHGSIRSWQKANFANRGKCSVRYTFNQRPSRT